MNEDIFLDVDHTQALQTSCTDLTAKELAVAFLVAVITLPFAWIALACLMAL